MIVFYRRDTNKYILFNTESQNCCENTILWMFDRIEIEPFNYSVTSYDNIPYSESPSKMYRHLPCSPHCYLDFINYLLAQHCGQYCIEFNEYIDYYLDFKIRCKHFMEFFKNKMGNYGR